jgi:hypothetical protein
MSRKPPVDLSPSTIRAHERACGAGQAGYMDPQTGLFVMTKFGLVRRGTCCGNACRHCPYDWKNVS